MRPEKKQMVQEVMGLIDNRPFILITYKGLKANVFNAFRAKLSEPSLNAACRVVPNTLLRIAAKQVGLDALADTAITGDTALISGSDDPVALAKAVREFAKGREEVKVKLSVVEGAMLSEADTYALADLPSREVLLAQVLGLLQAPAGQLARVLNAKVASIVYVLNDYCTKKGQVA
ncbi:MAG: 50S ribosomal protein L10 [Lentisphaerae bacterium]|jgi:large subunit ribosomal protein L10|nr:50S ribosomal protein L10 [Lentisphaerota bacterium]